MNTKWAEGALQQLDEKEQSITKLLTIFPEDICMIRDIQEWRDKVLSWDSLCS
jgi:hypothetical protein